MSDIEESKSPVEQPRLVRCSCGSNYFTKRTPVRGIWESTLIVQEDGTIKEEGNGDSVRSLDEPKTVRCDDCGKRHPNPDSPNVPALAQSGGREN